jgi:choline-sulfatase
MQRRRPACRVARGLYTGHYPSLHGVTQTTGAAKESFDPDIFWLDLNGVPTMGDYFRAARSFSPSSARRNGCAR